MARRRIRKGGTDMKTYFEDPILTVVHFDVKDILTDSKDGDPSEEEFDLFP